MHRYIIYQRKKTGYTDIVENSDDEDIVDYEIDDQNTALKMKNGKGWIEKRTKKKNNKIQKF